MRRLLLLTLCLLLAATAARASVIDAPHNDTNNISCSDCHNYSAWWSYSVVQADSAVREATANAICLGCHGQSGTEVMASAHSSMAMGAGHREELGEWSRACVDCHNPHLQAQLNWYGAVPDSELYLVTGEMVAGTVSTSGEGSPASPYLSTFAYQNIETKQGWDYASTPWDAKTGSEERGLILVLSRTDRGNTYEVSKVNEATSTITVQGRIPSDYTDQTVAFGMIYGQLIRDQIQVANSSVAVRFFDPHGGYTSTTEESTGLCQVCHTQTFHFRNSGEVNAGTAPYDHSGVAETNCVDCHAHAKGFAHGGSGSSCGNALGCHGTRESHPAHVSPEGLLATDCDTCHNTESFPDFVEERDTVCAQCHDDGTGVAQPPPDWASPPEAEPCSVCHEAVPTTGAHGKHLAHAPIVCARCHSTAVQGSTAGEQHLDGNIDVYDSTPGDLGYPADKTKATTFASCSTAYCHSDAKGSYTTVTWTDAEVGLGCNACHGRATQSGYPSYPNGGPGSALANSHATHSEAANCFYCHYLTTRDGHSIAGGSLAHVNGTVDITLHPTFDGSCSDQAYTNQFDCENNAGFWTTPRFDYDRETKTCSNTACHPTAVQWGASPAAITANCGICHATPPRDNAGAGQPHTIHFGIGQLGEVPTVYGERRIAATADEYGFYCGFCHTTSPLEHQNDVAPGTTEDPKRMEIWLGAKDSAGQPIPGGGPLARGDVPVYDTSEASLSVDPGVAKDSQGTPIFYYGFNNGSCLNIYCHSDGRGGHPNATPKWSVTDAPSDCTYCHGNDSEAAITMASGSHGAHLSVAIGCVNCHGDTVADNRTIKDARKHVSNHFDAATGEADGAGSAVDVVPGPGVSFIYTAATGQCAAISCHGDITATWGSSVVLGCQDCHLGSEDVDDYAYGNQVKAVIDIGEWYVSGHGAAANYPVTGTPGATLASCAYCHDSAIGHGDDANPFRLAHSSGPEDKNELCLICHAAASSGYDPDDAGEMPLVNATVKAGANHFGYRHDDTADGGRFCWDCHDPHGDSNIFMIHDSVTIASDGITGVPRQSGAVTFTSRATGSDFARSAAPYNGICNVCHALTNHYTATAGDAHNAETICVNCHTHDAGFAHGGSAGASGDCVQCHGHDAGSAYDPDMTAAVTPEAGSSSMGAGTVTSHSTHTELDDDDLRGPGIYCADCHDLDNMPRFKNQDASGNHTLAETDICDSCHSPAGSYDGVNDPMVGAKANWATGIYDADGNFWPGREKWCASCHDEAPSVINGIAAPNIVGDEDGAFTYGSGWGYYKTGHGLDASTTTPGSGGVTTGAGAPCTICHSAASTHIDGLARTFDDNDATTADPSLYRIGYRLIQVTAGTGVGVTGKEPMLVPRPQNVANTANNSRLCMRCHDDGPFTDGNNMNTNLVTDGVNRHAAHLKMNNYAYSADWSGTRNSLITCVNCHNVHGSTKLAMVRDGALTGTEPGLMIWYNNNAIVANNITNTAPPSPEDLPLSASTGTIWRGLTAGNLCNHCHGNDNTTPEYRSVYQNVSTAPVLNWSKEVGFEADGASPDAAVSGANFEFRVEYRHTENTAPTTIQVWIDDDNSGTYESSEKISLTETDADDTTYYNGKLFAVTVELDDTLASSKPYRFYAVGGTEAIGPATSEGSVSILAPGAGSGSAPLLDWTGENDYLADGVHPQSAVSGSLFTFRVAYRDAENEPPAAISVWIDEDGNGAFAASEKHAMSEDGGGADYSAGRFFTAEVTLTCAGGCTPSYRFSATDGASESTGLPTALKTVTVNNNAPTLSWTGETGFEADGTAPDTVEGGSEEITFQVEYTDADNTLPASIVVRIDSDDSGVFDAGESHALTETDPGDTDLSDGKRYALTTTIPYVADGTMSYQFAAADGVDEAGGPASGKGSVMVTVPAGNSQPQLTFAPVDCITNGVRPALGAEGADFEFMVTYTDADGQCPTAIAVWIDEDDDGSYEVAEKYALAETDSGDSDCADGKLYGLSKPLLLFGDNTFSYRFYATDGYEPAGGVATGDSAVTVVDALKVRPAGGFGWYSTIGGAVSAASDPTTILVYPNADYSATTYAENILLGYAHNRTIASVCGAELTTIASATGNTTVVIQDSDNPVIAGFTLTGATNDNQAGIYINRDVSGVGFEISNNIITGNTIGISVNDSNGHLVSIANNEIYANTVRGIISQSDVVMEIVDTVIHSHDTTASGSAVFLNFTTATTIKRSIIRDNTTTGSATVYTQGGDLTVENTVFADNQAANGGAIQTNSGPTVTVTNVTFANNTATTSGGAIYLCGVSPVAVRNSIFWNNSAPSGNNAYYACGGYTTDYMTVINSSVDTTSNDFGNGTIITADNMDPAQDPLFVDADANDFHLQAGSPMIDAAAALYAPADDMDGQARYAGQADDLGADEYDIDATSTTTGTALAVAQSDTAITLTMPYLGDSNGDNTYTVDYKLTADAEWSTWVSGAAHAQNPFTTTITGLTPGAAYDLRLTFADDDGVEGSNPQTIAAFVLPIYASTAGTAQAEPASDNAIAVSMPYTEDDNSDSTYTVEYKLTADAEWSTWVTGAAHTSSPYTTTITGLIQSATYDVRMTYNDADTVAGTNPQTVTGIELPAVSTTAGAASAEADGDTTIAVAMSYTDDGNGDSTYTVDYKLTADSEWSNWVTDAAHTSSPYTTTITDLTPGATYDVRMTFNDADTVSGTNPQIVSAITLPFTLTAAGSATAEGVSDTEITVTMPYSGDEDTDSTYTVDYKLAVDAEWSNWVTTAGNTPSPYVTTITNLTPGETYQVRMTYHDPDTVTGSNPQSVAVSMSGGAEASATVCASGCDHTTITAAIAAAVDGEIIEVHDGTYSENIDYGSKNITIRSQNGAVATSIVGSGANTPVVTFANANLTSAVLDGFTIDNSGSNNGMRGVRIAGGATPTIKNARIQGNTLPNYVSGAGIYIEQGGLHLENTTVGGSGTGNTGQYGTGIYAKTTSGGPYPLSIVACTINDNQGVLGGGIYVDASFNGAVSIANSTIANNTAAGGHGAGIYTAVAITVTNSDITANTDTTTTNYGKGGGIYLTGTDQASTISGGSVTGNTSAMGAGIFVDGGADLTINGAMIAQNQVDNQTGGGAFVNGAGSTLTANGTVFAGNDTVQYGGAIYNNGGAVNLTNCNLTGNTADGASYSRGGAIYTTAATAVVTITNSTLAGNFAWYAGGALYHNGGSTTVVNSIFRDNTSDSVNPTIFGAPTITYSIVEGGYAGSGNIDIDPLFVTPAQAVNGSATTAGDFHIQTGSGAMDQGQNDGAPAVDIDGEPRPQGDGVDIGADERG